MEHFICRCKHCGTQYTYCTYGNDDGSTEEYCGTCAKAIYDALRRIPIKFQSAKKMIIDPFEVERIVKIFNEEKEKFYSSNSIKMTRIIYDWGYESVEGCYIDGVEFYRCIDKFGHMDIYALMEYDIIEKEYTNKYYFENKNPRRQYFLLSQMKFDKFKKECIKVFPMKEPEGKLFYNDLLTDIEWEIIPFDKDK